MEGETTFGGNLRIFAQNLAPAKCSVKRANKTIHEMSQTITGHFKGSGVVNRIVPYGSLPKKTSVKGMMDIDVIVFINNRHPPFHDIIDELHDILPCQSCRCRSNCRCGKHEYGIKFCFDDFKIDLLPAVNFLPKRLRNGDGNRQSEMIQHKRALKYVKKVPKIKRHYYSTSLSGASVLFEKQRDSYSHCLSRLAKLWGSKVPGVGNIIVRSSIMEYMGAYAADQQRGKQDIVEGFRRFLKLFESFEFLNIYWPIFYSERDIPKRVRKHRPLLLDPCNPYNNFFDIEDNADKLGQMHSYAEATLARLNESQRNFNAVGNVNIEDIFDQNYLALMIAGENGIDRMHRIPPQGDCEGCFGRCTCLLICVVLFVCFLAFVLYSK